MAISIRRYVDITSGVGAGLVVQARELIGRLFTTNMLVPTKTVMEFESADEVRAHFGSASVEYLRAVFYFGWVSKNITRARKLSFYRWADVATEAQAYGAAGNQSLSNWTAINNGSFVLSLAGITKEVSGLDFTADTSLTDVATTMQVAVQAADASPFWANADVTWDAALKRFVLTSSSAGEAVIDITAGVTGTNVAGLAGWTSPLALFSDGVDATTVTDTLNESANISTNFGSFLFIPALTEAEVVEAAQFSNVENVRYMFCNRVATADAADIAAATADYAGVALTLGDLADQYPEMVPMTVLAATDYSKRNSVQNYMYQRDFPLSPSVTTDAEANAYDALRINYWGLTQQAGQLIEFYQRGDLQGPASAPLAMNTYANEIWLKDAATVACLSLLLNLSRISANAAGRALVIGALQAGPIEQGLLNGTISIGKTLTNDQKAFITQQTGDDLAWYQVQNTGYWLDAEVEQRSETEYVIVYTLIYSKDDAVRKIEGSHQLI